MIDRNLPYRFLRGQPLKCKFTKMISHSDHPSSSCMPCSGIKQMINNFMNAKVYESPNTFSCCFASYSATSVMESWNNFGPTSLLLPGFVSCNYMFLHLNIQTGGVVLQRV